jgi:hypothetical protein
VCETEERDRGEQEADARQAYGNRERGHSVFFHKSVQSANGKLKKGIEGMKRSDVIMMIK